MISAWTSNVPRPDEVELHVFGPGYGESLLIHTGSNRWLIVDSCRKNKSAQPAAIEWLEQIGVDPASAVTHVIATHWHDDHVRGLGEVLRRCHSAGFICSNALLSKELLALVEDSAQPLKGHSSGVDEIHQVVDELQRRKRAANGRSAGIGIQFASANQRVVNRATGNPTCEVWSLSPSSAEIELSLREFGRMLEDGPKNAAKPVVRPAKPNDTAVVLWIRVGARTMLLGADLEERRSSPSAQAVADCGWTAVVASTSRPDSPAEVFKVAHHGSETGHNEDIWTRLLGADPLSLLSPFRNGSSLLPTVRDQKRILDQSGEAYISSSISGKKYKPKDRAIAWAYQGKKPVVSPGMGHIVARASCSGSVGTWQVELLEGARPLSKA